MKTNFVVQGSPSKLAALVHYAQIVEEWNCAHLASRLSDLNYYKDKALIFWVDTDTTYKNHQFIINTCPVDTPADKMYPASISFESLLEIIEKNRYRNIEPQPGNSEQPQKSIDEQFKDIYATYDPQLKALMPVDDLVKLKKVTDLHFEIALKQLEVLHPVPPKKLNWCMTLAISDKDSKNGIACTSAMSGRMFGLDVHSKVMDEIAKQPATGMEGFLDFLDSIMSENKNANKS